jgi:hypothetical protein
MAHGAGASLLLVEGARARLNIFDRLQTSPTPAGCIAVRGLARNFSDASTDCQLTPMHTWKRTKKAGQPIAVALERNRGRTRIEEFQPQSVSTDGPPKAGWAWQTSGSTFDEAARLTT